MYFGKGRLLIISPSELLSVMNALEIPQDRATAVIDFLRSQVDTSNVERSLSTIEDCISRECIQIISEDIADRVMARIKS